MLSLPIRRDNHSKYTFCSRNLMLSGSLNPLKAGQRFGRWKFHYQGKELLCLNPLKAGQRFGPICERLFVGWDPCLNPLKAGQRFGPSSCPGLMPARHGLNPLKAGQRFGLQNEVKEEWWVVLSQSPQGGAKVRTKVGSEAGIGQTKSQSPQGGAKVRTNMFTLSDVVQAKVSIPSRRGKGSDVGVFDPKMAAYVSQSPQGGAKVRTETMPGLDRLRMWSQSPQGGAKVRTLVDYPWSVCRYRSQSPQGGAKVRTNSTTEALKTCPPVSIPSRRGKGSDLWPDGVVVDPVPSLNPLKAGQRFGPGSTRN